MTQKQADKISKNGNGTLVDGENMTEVETFQRYTAEKHATPASKTMLSFLSDGEKGEDLEGWGNNI